MQYTILVCDDNSLYGSCKVKIMQREKLFNKICFLVAPYYNGYDMSKCTVIMRYLLPISKEFNMERLVLSEERYKDYLKYVLPIDTNLSKEWGDIELNLTFMMLDTDNNGDIIQRVRKTGNHLIHITKIANWDSFIPDPALEALDQRILKQDEQIRALEDLADAFNNNQVDNLVYNSTEETLQLSSRGVGVGNKISVRDMIDEGIPVVDLNSKNENENENDQNSEQGNNGQCCCKDDNMVEF